MGAQGRVAPTGLHSAYHTVAWATEALDEVRRAVWNEARRGNRRQHAVALKGARWALWKNGDNLSPNQRNKLAWVQRVNKPLYQAYLIKEHLPPDLPAHHRRRHRPAHRVAEVGLRQPAGADRQASLPDRRPPGRAPEHAPAQPQQRQSGGPEHAHPPDRQARLRLPLRRGADRAGHARPGGLPALPARSSGGRHRLTRRAGTAAVGSTGRTDPTSHPC